jgi:antitoxin ParD1/3/4
MLPGLIRRSPSTLSSILYHASYFNAFLSPGSRKIYQELVYLMKNTMAKNTSILLGDYFENFINNQVKSGKYASASEVVRAALRLFEFEEWKKSELIVELKKGEESGFVRDFDRNSFLNYLHSKK